LYVVDSDNGLYQYSLNEAAYTGFYPAHRGTTVQTFESELVPSPEGVVPLLHPVAVALSPSGRVLVQEHVSGRVTMLQAQSLQSGDYQAYLPLISRNSQ
jgi:hypothetical protein